MYMYFVKSRFPPCQTLAFRDGEGERVWSDYYSSFVIESRLTEISVVSRWLIEEKIQEFGAVKGVLVER